MALDTRLQRLEARAAAAAGYHNGSKKEFIDRLDAGAERMEGLEFTESWCAKSSPMEIACAAWHELATGKRKCTLWDKVTEFAGGSDARAKLFAGILEAAHAV